MGVDCEVYGTCYAAANGRPDMCPVTALRTPCAFERFPGGEMTTNEELAMMRIDRRILDTVDDLLSNFLYYDRKEDDAMPVGAIEDAVIDGMIRESEIVATFAAGIAAAVKTRATKGESELK
jgi:hypothetical protein